MTEIFKDISGYEGLYKISNFGNVKSSSKNKLMKLQKDKNGYFVINLYKDRKYRRFRVHRLVAQAFIQNPQKLPCINHIDENKQNNRVNNLEWCDIAYNNNYKNRQFKIAKKREKSVMQLSLDEKIINIYSSIREAEKHTGVANQSITKVCKAKRKTAGGYIWKYKEVC